MRVIRHLTKTQLELIQSIINQYGGLPAPQMGVPDGGGIHVPFSETTHIIPLLADPAALGDYLLTFPPELGPLYEQVWQDAKAAVLGGTAAPWQTFMVSNLPQLYANLEDMIV